MKIIYLIRHSAPFVEIENYDDYESVPWNDYNRNMILSVEGEDNAKKLCEVDELNDLDVIYSADSFRAIGTAKYVANMNNLKIKLDDRINERNIGVNFISEIPENYTLDSFSNKDYKLETGESLNEVDKKFNSFLDEILDSDYNKIGLFIHGIIMMSFLQNITNFSYDGKNVNLIFKGREIYNGKMKNPMIFKIVYEEKSIINVEEVSFND